MTITKHATPARCKILQALGFVSMSRMFARCCIGVKPYKSCRGCENNFREIFYEGFQRGLKEGKEAEWLKDFTEEGGNNKII